MEGGSGETRDAGAEIEETDDEANAAQWEIPGSGCKRMMRTRVKAICWSSPADSEQG